MKVAVIIVMYNGERRNWIIRCLESLTKSILPCKVIIIDNKSQDQSVDIVRRRFKKVTLIESAENIGFGCANNLGIERALSEDVDYVFLLNQDARIEENTIENLVRIAIDRPDYGILSPIHLNDDGTDLDFNFKRYVSESYCPNFLGDLFFHRIKSLYEVDFINAAAWLITKECLLKVGGFNPVFFMYGEDRNYVDRVRFHGFKVGIGTNANIFHDRKIESHSFDYGRINKLRLFSMPGKDETIEKEKRSLVKMIYKNLFLLRFSRSKYYKSKVTELQKMPAELTRNKHLSERVGPTFLALN